MSLLSPYYPVVPSTLPSSYWAGASSPYDSYYPITRGASVTRISPAAALYPSTSPISAYYPSTYLPTLTSAYAPAPISTYARSAYLDYPATTAALFPTSSYYDYGYYGGYPTTTTTAAAWADPLLATERRARYLSGLDVDGVRTRQRYQELARENELLRTELETVRRQNLQLNSGSVVGLPSATAAGALCGSRLDYLRASRTRVEEDYLRLQQGNAILLDRARQTALARAQAEEEALRRRKELQYYNPNNASYDIQVANSTYTRPTTISSVIPPPPEDEAQF